MRRMSSYICEHFHMDDHMHAHICIYIHAYTHVHARVCAHTQPRMRAHTESHACLIINALRCTHTLHMVEYTREYIVQLFAHILSAARSREYGGTRQEARFMKSAQQRALVGCAEAAWRCDQVGRWAARRVRRAVHDQRRPLVPIERAAARWMRRRKGRLCK